MLMKTTPLTQEELPRLNTSYNQKTQVSTDTQIDEIIGFWNKQPNLRKMRLDAKTKTHRQTVIYLDRVLNEGFQRMKLDFNWIKENEISPENLKIPISKDRIIDGITKLNTLCLNPSKSFLQKYTLSQAIYEPSMKNSVLLQIINNTTKVNIYDKLKSLLFNIACENRERCRRFYSAYSGNLSEEELDVTYGTLEQIRLDSEKELNELLWYGKSAVNIASGVAEETWWSDADPRWNEVYQVIYDIYMTVIDPRDILFCLGKKNFKECTELCSEYAFMRNFRLVKDYFYFVSKTEPNEHFRINYMKVWGNGIWKEFYVFFKNNMRVEFVKREGDRTGLNWFETVKEEEDYE